MPSSAARILGADCHAHVNSHPMPCVRPCCAAFTFRNADPVHQLAMAEYQYGISSLRIHRAVPRDSSCRATTIRQCSTLSPSRRHPNNGGIKGDPIQYLIVWGMSAGRRCTRNGLVRKRRSWTHGMAGRICVLSPACVKSPS